MVLLSSGSIAPNASIDAIDMIEVIEKQGNSWRMLIDGEPFSFLPLSLYRGNDLFPIPADAEHGLRWRIERNKWVSYKQIKKAITSPPALSYPEEQPNPTYKI